MSWTFPTTNALSNAHAAFAKVANTIPMSSFLIGAEPMQLKVQGESLLDVSYWAVQNQVMIGVVNLNYADINRSVSIELPMKVRRVASQPWGSLSWSLSSTSSGYTVMRISGMSGLDTSVVILDIESSKTEL